MRSAIEIYYDRRCLW